MDVMAIGAKIGMFFVPFLFALCFHEFAHGWMAKRKGDNTAEIMGRLNLNPMSHIDWIGTVALPIASIVFGLPLFGWAQPVPVNPRNLSKPKEDMFWIALAGPLSNLLLFFIGCVVAFVLNRTPVGASLVAGNTLGILNSMLQMFLIINLLLALFNMIPLHPLDGGKVLARFLPYEANRWLEENQVQLQFVLIGLLIFGFFRYLAIPIFYITGFFWVFVGGPTA
jgi:Zn-dependent protease